MTLYEFVINNPIPQLYKYSSTAFSAAFCIFIKYASVSLPPNLISIPSHINDQTRGSKRENNFLIYNLHCTSLIQMKNQSLRTQILVHNLIPTICLISFISQNDFYMLFNNLFVTHKRCHILPLKIYSVDWHFSNKIL